MRQQAISWPDCFVRLDGSMARKSSGRGLCRAWISSPAGRTAVGTLRWAQAGTEMRWQVNRHLYVQGDMESFTQDAF